MLSNKRSLSAYLPWIVVNAGICSLAFVDHLPVVEVVGFIAVFVSILLFTLSYRAEHGIPGTPMKYGPRISAWATFVTVFLYLAFSRWPS